MTMNRTQKGRIKALRNTEAGWSASAVIGHRGEPLYETDTGRFKWGNGVDLYDDLPYAVTGALSDGARVDIEIDDGGDSFLIIEPQVKAVKDVYKHLSTWASLSSLVTDANANPTTLYHVIVDETPTLNNTTLPNNLNLDYSKGFGLNVNSGQIVYITPPTNTPGHRLFTGSGQVRYKKHPAFTYVDAVLYLDDGSGSAATISSSQSEAMRYGPFLNSSGGVLLPIGEYEIDHDWVLQRGWIAGRGNDPNGYGTIVRRIAGGSGQPAAFTFLEGGRTMYVRQIGIENDESNGCGMLAYSAAASPQSIDGIHIENVTVYGGSEGFRVHHDHANKNWQVHNIFIDRNVNFLDQTTACLRCNAINSGGTFYPKVRPAAGARGQLLEAAAKWEWGGDGAGILPESLPGSPPATVQFNFTSSDVNTSTNAITSADGDDLQTGDSVYFTTTGTLPAPLALNTRYNWNATNKTLHTNPANAATPSEAVDLTDGGSGTHKLWSTRPHPDCVAGQPGPLIEIAGPMQEGFVGLPMARDEGFHTFMKVTSAVGTERALPINLFGVHSQGQFDIQGSVDIDVYGGVYRAEAFKDVAGVSARIRNFGARIWTYGVGGPTNNYGGYTVADPWFDDFKGGSAFLDDHRPGGPSYHGVYGNNAPMWGLRVFNNNTANKLRMWAERIGSGDKAGWTGFRNWANGVNDAQSGYDFDGGLGIKGRFLQSRTDTATGTSGTITLNLSLGQVHTVTPTGNATIEVSNGPSGHTMHVYLVVLTSGTTSYNLSQGTLSVMQAGAFATGTVSGALYVLEFFWNGSYLIETGRNPGAGGGVDTANSPNANEFARFTDADTIEGRTVSETKTDLSLENVTNESKATMFTNSALTGTTTSQIIEVNHSNGAVKLKDRAGGATFMHLYSDMSGDFHIYRDLSAANVLSITGGNLFSLPNAVRAQFGRKYRTGGTAASATPTPDADSQDVFVMTAATAAFEWQTPAGSPQDRQRIRLWAKDNGTGRAITYAAIYRAIGVTLPTTTVANKWIMWEIEYDSTAAKWNVTDVKQEA